MSNDLSKELIDVTRNGFSGLEKKQDIMIEKQDIMIGLQYKTITNIENLGVHLGNKIDQNRSKIKSEIHALRDDFKSYFDQRLSKMEIELAEIKIRVAQIQHSS